MPSVGHVNLIVERAELPGMLPFMERFIRFQGGKTDLTLMLDRAYSTGCPIIVDGISKMTGPEMYEVLATIHGKEHEASEGFRVILVATKEELEGVDPIILNAFVTLRDGRLIANKAELTA